MTHPKPTPKQAQETISSSSAIIKGSLMTVAFYGIAPYIPGSSEFIQRYFCGHPIEYASTWLFCIGVGILWEKVRQLGRERAAVNSIGTLRQQLKVDTPENRVAAVEELRQWELAQAKLPKSTGLRRRVHDAMHYVHGRDDGSLEDHLRYLADLATERLHQSFALMRTVTWAIPILGFLGTVIGITVAIANVTPEQLDSSLPEVTAGLAIAFDTTAQALGMSIVLVFGAFLVERGEQSILNEIEQFGIDSLQLWLRTAGPKEPEKKSELVGISEWTEVLLRKQTQSWNQHLNDLQSQWSSALSTQTEQLNHLLDQELQNTLKVHRDSSADARDTYTSVLQQSSQMFTQQLQQSLTVFADRVQSWQNAMLVSSQASAQQSEELHKLGRTLLQLTEAEERLADLQKQLADNLQMLQLVSTLEETVSSLNAAVHVLTAKSHLRSAA
ncbi:MAG: MotA/TolQ/ExbB proton channel family protein [Planctomyces sp.]|nr:MotA/TolQ/ExbB proton channel family protein [Planctomyces sp.]